MAIRSNKVSLTSKADSSIATSINFARQIEKQMEVLRDSIRIKGAILDLDLEDDNQQYYDNFLVNLNKNCPLSTKNKITKNYSPDTRVRLLQMKSKKKSNSKIPTTNSYLSPHHSKNNLHNQFFNNEDKTKKARSPRKSYQRSKFKFNTANLSFTTELKTNEQLGIRSTVKGNYIDDNNKEINKDSEKTSKMQQQPTNEIHTQIKKENKIESHSSKENFRSQSHKNNLIIKQNTQTKEILQLNDSKHETPDLNSHGFQSIEKKGSSIISSSNNNKFIGLPAKKELSNEIGGVNNNNINNDDINNNINNNINNENKEQNGDKVILTLLDKPNNDDKYKSNGYYTENQTPKQGSLKDKNEEIKAKKRKFFLCCIPIK